MACEDVDGVSGEAPRAWISTPRLGKHISFDGRFLHAAPADLARSGVLDDKPGAGMGSGMKRDHHGSLKSTTTTTSLPSTVGSGNGKSPIAKSRCVSPAGQVMDMFVLRDALSCSSCT